MYKKGYIFSICLDYHRDDFRGEVLIRKLRKPKMAMLSFKKKCVKKKSFSKDH